MADGQSTARHGDVGSLCEPQKWTGSRILQAAYVIGPGPGRAEHTLRPDFGLSTATSIADATVRHLAAFVLDARVDLDLTGSRDTALHGGVDHFDDQPS